MLYDFYLSDSVGDTPNSNSWWLDMCASVGIL